MTRDELLELLRMVNVDELSDDYIFLHEKAIAWLEDEGNAERERSDMALSGRTLSFKTTFIWVLR